MKSCGPLTVTRIALSVIITLAVATGCHRATSSGTFKWPVVSAESDSLSQAIDFHIFHRTISDTTASMVARLEAMADDSRLSADDREELAGRAAYFSAYLSRIDGRASRGDSIVQATIAATDSAAHPYLFNRLLHLEDNNTEVSIGEFVRLTDRLHFFESVGDNFMSAAHYTELGNLLKDIRDPEAALSAYHAADSLYRLTGFDEIATFNSLNVGITRLVARDTVGTVEIYRSILASPVVNSRPDIKAKVYHNLYNAIPSDATLDSLLKYDNGTDRPARVLNIRSEAAFRHGDYAEAVRFANEAVDRGLEDGDGDAIAFGLYNGANALAESGNKAEAYDWLHDAVSLTDTIALMNETDELAALESGRQIARHELEIQVAEGKRTLMWVCIGFALFIVLCVVAYFVWRYIRRLMAQRREAAAERDRISRQLMATQIVMDETEKLIDTVSREIDDKADSGRLSHGETRNIVSAIKTHATKHGERQAFMDSMATIHPDFPKRLRQINPAFTELDIRLAGFIAMGMDTKHIADTLGVRPESVKQARWRLRNKLSLPKGASLEDALRELI